jgi:hypothetical protein
MRDSYLVRKTVDIRPKTNAEDPDGDDDVGQEAWPISIDDEAHPEELRLEHERRREIREEFREAEREARMGPGFRGGFPEAYPPQQGAWRGRGGPRDAASYPAGEEAGYPPQHGYPTEMEPPPMPRDQPPSGFAWGFDGRRWLPVPLPTPPAARPEESITALLVKKLLDGPAAAPGESPEERAARLQREAEDREERATKRRRDEAEWEDRRAREKAADEERRARERVEHDERVATMALQREKLVAEIRALATPAAPAAPAVNPQEIADRAVAKVRLEHAEAENRRLQAAHAAAVAAAQTQAARPVDPVAEMRRRADQVAQIREVARSLGMVEKTDRAIEAAGGITGFSLNEFMDSEAGAVVAERGMDLLARLLVGPNAAADQTTVVQQHHQENQPPPPSQSAELPPAGYPAGELQESPQG